MKTTKLTGGKKGFCAAIENALHISRCHNSCVRYTDRHGFYVQSTLTPADSDVLWEHVTAFFPNSGDPSIRPRHYAEIRAEILVARAGKLLDSASATP